MASVEKDFQVKKGLVVGSGDVSTTNASANLLNTPASVSAFQAATALSLGATSGTTTVNNNLTVTGNLTVSGTTTSVNSTTITVNDPVLALSSNATATTDTLSRGVSYKYGDGTTAKTGFFGLMTTASGQKFSFIPEASEATGNTFTGTLGAFDLSQTSVYTFAGTTGSRHRCLNVGDCVVSRHH